MLRPKYLDMKTLDGFDEAELERALANDILLLGLGDLDVKDIQRPQPGGGRLDLLLFDAGADTRYEVELQLGALDESHIIRTIEYWDRERQRFPNYEHVAVVVAEDITSRFHNVIQLIGKGIPLIAIELKMIQAGNTHFLVATQVVKLQERGTEEEDEGAVVDRAYWVSRGAEQTVNLMEAAIAKVNEVVTDESVAYEPKFNQQYVGLTQTGGPLNFITFTPKKKFVLVKFKIPQEESLSEILDEAGMDTMTYEVQHKNYRVRLYPGDLDKFDAEIRVLIDEAYRNYFK